MSWLCRLGLHKWSMWEDTDKRIDWTTLGEYTSTDAIYSRFCITCGRPQERLFKKMSSFPKNK